MCHTPYSSIFVLFFYKFPFLAVKKQFGLNPNCFFFEYCAPVPPTERPSDVKPSSIAGFIIHPGFPATHNVVTNGNPKTSAIVPRSGNIY
jgi:hypothetical protein